MKNKYRILIVDDDRAVCTSLRLILQKKGYDVRVIHHPSRVIDSVLDFDPQVVILDMNFTINTSGQQGLVLLQQIKAHRQEISVILITGWATLQLAVEGMKQGARDFLSKPWDNKHLLSSVEAVLSIYHGNTQKKPTESDHKIIGRSPAFLHALSIVDRVAPTDANVLITGPSGSGKEIIAEAIHQRSKRSAHPFIKVNLGGISTSLFESEMFGHVRGAFTDAHANREGRFAKAEKGTIFLDEIGDLALESQVKLLRVLQEKKYEILGSSKSIKTDVRIICATHRLLQDMITSEDFREDLYYRINLITIQLPSLAERLEDIPLLVTYFLHRVSTDYQIDIPYINDETMSWLTRQEYRGNIRQLRNLIERTALLTMDKKEIKIADFQAYMLAEKNNSLIRLPQVGDMTLEEMEKKMILRALDYHNHSISKTARSLGLTRSSLYRRLQKHGIVHGDSNR